MQRYENVSFPEAVQEVASIVGVPLSVHGDEQRQIDPHKETLYKILKETIRYSMFQINTPEAKAEKEYLDGRGLDSEVRKTFEIGYNPPGSHLYEFLKAKGYKEEDMAACNVVRPGSFGMSDVFAGRITFPIHDAYGNPIGFSARTIDKNNPSKYINTNDT
ncbi:MAG TPA: DNA primase, partial [Erysipelotrichaceae bacterium]|nr:DNA primase [Erysipelotrichaceae bacterium]